MLAPKRRFQSAYPEITKAIADVMVSGDFQQAAESALLELVAELPNTTDPLVAAGCYHRIMGARQYLEQLLSIAKPPGVPGRRQLSGTLNY
jgi:hypothetical protein